MKDELELSIKDLIMRIMLRWRFIIAAAVLFGVLLAGVGAYKNYTHVEVVEVEKVVIDEEELDHLRGQLTEEEVKAVEVSFEMYQTYITQYDYLENYLEESLWMKLDANNVPVMRTMYQVSGDELSPEECNAIASNYAWIIDSKEVYQDIAAEMGLDVSYQCIKELVEIEKNDNGSFVVKVMSENEEQCKQMMQVIDEKIKSEHKNNQNLYGKYEFVRLESKFSCESDKDMLTVQQRARSDFLGIVDDINILDDYFSEKQFDLYNKLVQYEEQQHAYEEVQEEVAEPSEPQKVDLFSLKYTVLGIALGIIASCGWILVTYVFSPYLRKENDLENVFAIPTLARVRTEEKKKKLLHFIDKIIWRIFRGKTEEINLKENICINVRKIVNTTKVSSIYLVSTCVDEKIQEMQKEICKELGDDLNVKMGVFEEEDAKVLEDMVNSEMVILFEKVGCSKNEKIQRVIDICDMHDICVGGSVIYDTY